MNIDRLFDSTGTMGVSGLWSLSFDGRTIDGKKSEIDAIHPYEGDATALYGDLMLHADFETEFNDICVRNDSITNTGDNTATVNRCYSRFAFPGGEYDVYTQASGWEYESEGAWQKLTTRVTSENRGIRATQSAAPMLAVYNRQNNRGIVFHILSNAAWKITAGMEADGEETRLVVEAGVNDKGLSIKLAPNEKLELPKIIFYTFTDRRDLECDRLQGWFLNKFPRRTLPVIFNTWMMTFDRLDADKIINQARLAAETGAEYFVIDAGWFGNNGRWYENIGVWEENLSGAFAGRMKDVADNVRALGMKFGLWLEIERALPNVPIVKEHPEWFFFNEREYFVDFGNADARNYMIETASGLIEKYGIEFIKFDFNADLSFDESGSGFLRWHRGHEMFLQALRDRFDGIYLECCASGGLRMDMYAASIYDSCWISDNHSLYFGTRIIKDTSLRLPPNCIERWPVLKDADGFINYESERPVSKLIACNDATWGNIRGVNESWLRTFTNGGPLGFSFDLTAVSDKTRAMFADIVKAFKDNRDFYRSAVSRLICDTENITAIQYTGKDGNIKIALFVWNHRQKTIDLYPEAVSGVYIYDGAEIKSDEIKSCGIRATLPAALNGAVIELQIKRL